MSMQCHVYEEKKLTLFETLCVVPRASISVRTKFGYRNEVFLIDTGADITMLPRSARELFEGPFEDCSQLVYGIEGEGIGIFKSKIRMRICEREVDVRCVFSKKDNIPFILGRLDIINRFNIHFLESEACFEERNGEFLE